MAISGLSSLEREPFISKEDPSLIPGETAPYEESIANGATVFWLKNIPHGSMAVITDMQSAQQVSLVDGGVQTFVTRRAQKAREAFRKGVAGWDNFPDKEGNPIKFETEQSIEGGERIQIITNACMNKIPTSLITEVGEAAFNRNSMTEPQRKKYEELSSAFAGSDISNVASATDISNLSADAQEMLKTAGTGETPSTTSKAKKKAPK